MVERQPNLVVTFAYMKDLYDVDPSNISGVVGGKESEQEKGGVHVTSDTTYKTPFTLNIQPVTFYFDLGEGMVCKNIFSSLLLKKKK